MEKLTEFNNQLMGAPSGILLFLAIIAIGYALKGLHWFPNTSIPAVLLVVGVGLWLLVAPRPAPDENLRNWWGRNLLIGVIIPCSSWLLHKVVLKRIERKIGVFDKSFDTEAVTKPPEKKP